MTKLEIAGRLCAVPSGVCLGFGYAMLKHHEDWGLPLFLLGAVLAVMPVAFTLRWMFRGVFPRR